MIYLPPITPPPPPYGRLTLYMADFRGPTLRTTTANTAVTGVYGLVPEPTTMALAAAVGVGVVGRRRPRT